jgi:two-component system chemotaxis response regulator CheY
MPRILVVDDDQHFRDMLIRVLEDAGHEVTHAANGEEGLRAYRAAPPDAVVIDLVMPGKEGIETIMQLKREFPAARVIAMSGGGRRGNTSYLEVAGKLGASRMLAKPFTIEQILGVIDDLLGS